MSRNRATGKIFVSSSSRWIFEFTLEPGIALQGVPASVPAQYLRQYTQIRQDRFWQIAATARTTPTHRHFKRQFLRFRRAFLESCGMLK